VAILIYAGEVEKEDPFVESREFVFKKPHAFI
jgi:hypothetical protein